MINLVQKIKNQLFGHHGEFKIKSLLIYLPFVLIFLFSKGIRKIDLLIFTFILVSYILIFYNSDNKNYKKILITY
ncbi:MAG: hypothetical protein PWP46_2039 [Fusobacteriaceae bacterium]|jgi:hypothetical protein|nr:hypothetical protein [Fusobacteriales bacterium]MDN5305153.1 hypothetical protein [Fusobacteriaceae bacterium]